jgi:hypothetical protein
MKTCQLLVIIKSEAETPRHCGSLGAGGLYPDWGNQLKDLEPANRVMLEHAGAR